MTWQAIAAFAGLFTLFSAHADPVDLWRITVLSHQGEPLKAVATLESLPEERITEACLSLGSEADAPGSDAPLLKQANLKLNAARTAVEISTDAPVSSPSLELVLRVQCPGTFLYARHFSTLIPPASASITGSGIRNGFKLKVGGGETVGSLAATVAPGNRKLQKQLIQDVLAANPHAFPDGKARAIPAGTVLWFPDLRRVGKSNSGAGSVAAKPSRPPARPTVVTAPSSAVTEPTREPAPVAPKPKRPKRSEPAAAMAGGPVKLRQALELGEKPGPQECRMLLPLCGILDTTGTPPPSPDTQQRANGLESGIQALKLKQDSIDSQLSRLEQSLQELKKVVESRPAAVAPTPAPAPAPKPEIRTVVRTEYKTAPIPWYLWAGILVAALGAAAGGFFYGRRRAYSDSLSDSEDRLDEMLASAADEMRDLDRVPSAPTRLPKATPPPPPPSARATEVNNVNGTAISKPEAPDLAFDKTQIMQSAANVDVDLELVSGAGEHKGGESTPGVSTDLAFEMDQALDNTRSMFTDVDRFIALGRTQNALSLLQFQVVKDPKDRDSWIKLLAIYRQEKMDAELDKALREFRRNFPNDKATI